jgi:hypothetical protein
MSEEPSTLKVIASQVALAAIDGGAPPKIHDAVLTYIFEIKRCAYSRLKVLLLLSNPVNARHH